jgi:hypothetical protein
MGDARSGIDLEDVRSGSRLEYHCEDNPLLRWVVRSREEMNSSVTIGIVEGDHVRKIKAMAKPVPSVPRLRNVPVSIIKAKFLIIPFRDPLPLITLPD